MARDPLVMGSEFMNAVAGVLGLPLTASKLVIEAEAGGVVKVYVRTFCPLSGLPAIVQAVADVAVADDGTVSITPHVVTGGPQP